MGGGVGEGPWILDTLSGERRRDFRFTVGWEG